MPNLFWYIYLAFFGIAMTAFAIYTKKNIRISTFVVFYLFATGITWIGEFIALGIFNGYAYKPGLFTDPWAENLAGHLILNSTLWPGAATLVAAYSFGYGWISLITAFFIFSEFLFMKLGIYEQHWWKFYMSIIIVVIFLNVAKKWYTKINQTYGRLTRAITYFFVWLVILHLPFPLLLLSHKQYYNVGLGERHLLVKYYVYFHLSSS